MTKFNTQFNNENVQLMAGYNTVSNGLGGSYEQRPQPAVLNQTSPHRGFASLPYETLTFSEGDTIFKEAEAPQGLYILQSGCVKIYINRDAARGRTTSPEYVTKLVSAGEVFGYKAVVMGSKTTSFAKAVKASTVWFYSLELIQKEISQAHPLVQQMLQQSVSDLQNYEKISQFHYLASVQERIAYQIITLADRFGVKTAAGVSLNLKLTRNEFAQLASTINESLSRHLTEFKNEGLIDINGKEIIILNREALAAKSGQISI